ncbi:tyrosine-type recombinase/integrase [Pseudoduganella sp. R-34]|uniref:tyrosine-type recombinase/integrase n=1 Tax=Pseudoduganella sp. R-34 TaxID=3404062 RepID=UPI003CEEE2AC
MAKVNFTAGRVAAFQCEQGKSQSFLWDSGAPGLGLRVTAKGARSYMFQAKLRGETIRITIGDPDTWPIDAPTDGKGKPMGKGARQEARRLKTLVDEGKDPRQVKEDQLAEERAAREEKEAQANEALAKQEREAVTLAVVWDAYIKERTPYWSAHHVVAHRKIAQPGGEKRKRGPGLTVTGPLASLMNVRMCDLSMECVEVWAREESQVRPSSGRLAIRLLKACLNWCAQHPTYSAIVAVNAAKSTKVREVLGKPRLRNDVLQREQLGAWFEAVRQIRNPVIAAYLQCLLMTGARREELASLKWADVDMRWKSLKLADKVEDFRMVPLTPYVANLLSNLPRRNEWVFSSPASESGRIAEPRIAHNEALAVAGLPHLTLHGLRRSFASLSEWVETPSGISAQIQGHAPQGVREQNYIRRPLDLLRKWHCTIEAWILSEAGVEFEEVSQRLRVLAS